MDKTTLDFIILLLSLGVTALCFALIAHAIKRRKRNRMIDPIDHRKWDK